MLGLALAGQCRTNRSVDRAVRLSAHPLLVLRPLAALIFRLGTSPGISRLTQDEMHSMVLSVGDQLPAFTLTDQDGRQRSTDELNGRCLVLFFYPKDDTPGCTLQAYSFRDSNTKLQKLGAVVWGVSGDDAVSHRRFAARHNLPFPLLSDTGNTLRRRFGVPKAMGLLPGRVTYICDSTGTIRQIFSNLLDGPAHVREASRVLKELSCCSV